MRKEEVGEEEREERRGESREHSVKSFLDVAMRAITESETTPPHQYDTLKPGFARWRSVKKYNRRTGPELERVIAGCS